MISEPSNAPASVNLSRMTKAQLLEYAAEVGADVDGSMTKAEIREALL